MRWEQIQVSWMEFRPRAKRHWIELSESQLDSINGNRELLADILQESYGLARDDADEEILAWSMTFGDDESPRPSTS
jgi:hypothetical protein